MNGEEGGGGAQSRKFITALNLFFVRCTRLKICVYEMQISDSLSLSPLSLLPNDEGDLKNE